MSRAQRRISTDDLVIAPVKQAPSRSDDRAFTKYHLEKIASKDVVQHTCLSWLSDGSALLVGTSPPA